MYYVKLDNNSNVYLKAGKGSVGFPNNGQNYSYLTFGGIGVPDRTTVLFASVTAIDVGGTDYFTAKLDHSARRIWLNKFHSNTGEADNSVGNYTYNYIVIYTI